MISLGNDYHSPWNKCPFEVQIQSRQIEHSRVFLIGKGDDQILISLFIK